MKSPEENLLNPEILDTERMISHSTPVEAADQYIEGAPENLRRFSKQADKLHERFWPELSKEHACYKETKRMLEDVLASAGFPRDYLQVVIFDSSIPDVHVQILEKKVRISREFFKLIKGNSFKLKAVLAHEVGHILLKHDDGTKTDRTDLVGNRVRKYEIEYQADRAGIVLTNRMGISPYNLSDVLGDLSKFSNKETDDRDEDRQLWILSTHPHSSRRVMAIKKEARFLPKYPIAEKRINIPVPQESDFDNNKGEIGKWSKTILDKDQEGYVDCLWDERPIPVAAYKKGLTEKIDDERIREFFVKPKNLIPSPSIREIQSVPLDATPDEVNLWDENDKEEMSHWWQQAMALMDDKDGYDDLVQEVMEYNPNIARSLIKHSCPEYSAIDLDDDQLTDPAKVEDVEYEKYNAQFRIMMGEYYSSTVELRIVTSILVKNIFENDTSTQTMEGLRLFCQFLRDFFNDHGEYVAYAGGRYFLRLEELFNSADDAGKSEVAQIALDYSEELKGGMNRGILLARSIMPKLCEFLDKNSPNHSFFFKKDKEKSKITEGEFLPEVIRALNRALNKEEVKKGEARDALLKISPHFRMKNMTEILASVVGGIYKDESEHGYSDHYLERNPVSSAHALSTLEFEEKYFGAGRTKYIKTEYQENERYIFQHKAISKLWGISGYEEEFKSMADGIDKLKFLFGVFKAVTSKRDILIAQALGWPEIKYIEDVTKIQERIAVENDINILFELQDSFFNPLLNFAVSQRLMEIYEKDPDSFFASVPRDKYESVQTSIVDLPTDLKTKKISAILCCYNNPTYVRDDLLRPLVDAAPDETSTMAVASFYCEPPPGILKPRSGEIVLATETILDAIQKMPKLDKQELFLYFLGHRHFYTGIEGYFDYKLKEGINSERRYTLFFSSQEKEHYPRNEDESDEEDDYEEAEDSKYIVSTPDSLIFLTKASGIPIDILLKQHKLTTTRREQRDFITQLLSGEDGLLGGGDKEVFLQSVAKCVVENSEWSKNSEGAKKESITDLLAFALSHCPGEKLPDLFLDLWNLQQEKESLPKVFTALLRALGSLFVKAGQYLGTQSNSLPPEWIKELRTLSDKNVRGEKTLVYEQVYATYGENPPFKNVGRKLGEGSMAAVYYGQLSDDARTEVAAKITHPYIVDELKEDSVFLRELVGHVNKNKADFNVTLPENLAEVSRAQVIRELSYEYNLKNSRDISKALEHSNASVKWRVPKIIEDKSKPGFVVLEYSRGMPIDALPADVSSNVKGEIALELLRQILVEGTYQADPNVGNFAVETRDGEIFVDWLDTDHAGRLSRRETASLREFIKELLGDKDVKKIANTLAGFVKLPRNESNESLISDVEGWLNTTGTLNQSSFTGMENIMTSFLDFLAERKQVLKDQYVTLLRTLGLMQPLVQSISMPQFLRLGSILSDGRK